MPRRPLLLLAVGTLLLALAWAGPRGGPRLAHAEGATPAGTVSGHKGSFWRKDAFRPAEGSAHRVSPAPPPARTSGTNRTASHDTLDKASPSQTPRTARYDSDRLPKRFHRKKRQAVLEALPSNAVAVFFSSPQRIRAGNVRHEYRQNSNLYYLTGTTEPASVLMLVPAGLPIDGRRVHEVLFVPPRTTQSDVWLGHRLGPARAERVLGIEKALSNEHFEKVLRRVAQSGDRRFYHLPLPYGVEEDSELADQLAVFRSAASLAPTASSPLTERAAEVMRTVADPRAFRTFQEQFRERFSAEAFQAPLLREAYRAFVDAPSLEDWTRWRSTKRFGPTRVDGQTLRDLLASMRVQKSPEEQRLLKRAAHITTEAQTEAIRAVRPGLNEYEIEALVEYVFKKSGAEAPAFPTLVGSGENTAVLQHPTNRRRMRAGDMVVIDAGAEYHGYAADVARSVPVDGTFSDEERAIYALVLEAQKAAIRAVRPGNNFRDPHQVARRILGEGLVDLGLIDDPNEAGRFFLHPTSHYLGLHAEDVGRGGPLAPGMVLAVEPGLYLRPAEDLPERWHHIGVRIEDDILVTEDGPVNLSEGVPRAIDALEQLMRERRTTMQADEESLNVSQR